MLSNELSPGAKANRSGRWFEGVVRFTFRFFDIDVMPYSKDADAHSLLWRHHFVLTRVPYTKIDGGNGFTEFVYYQGGKALTRIECKNQSTGGSTLEKLPSVIDNFKHGMPEPHLILLLEGDQMTPDLLERLTVQARSRTAKRVDVMRLPAFARWCQDLPYPEIPKPADCPLLTAFE